jgi:hypothetical protein
MRGLDPHSPDGVFCCALPSCGWACCTTGGMLGWRTQRRISPRVASVVGQRRHEEIHAALKAGRILLPRARRRRRRCVLTEQRRSLLQSHGCTPAAAPEMNVAAPQALGRLLRTGSRPLRTGQGAGEEVFAFTASMRLLQRPARLPPRLGTRHPLSVIVKPRSGMARSASASAPSSLPEGADGATGAASSTPRALIGIDGREIYVGVLGNRRALRSFDLSQLPGRRVAPGSVGDHRGQPTLLPRRSQRTPSAP